jgi:hypothetical protein
MTASGLPPAVSPADTRSAFDESSKRIMSATNERPRPAFRATVGSATTGSCTTVPGSGRATPTGSAGAAPYGNSVPWTVVGASGSSAERKSDQTSSPSGPN